MVLKIDTTLHGLRPLKEVVLSLGSNMADRLATLQGALDALVRMDGFVLHAVSAVYETAPWGVTDQDDFLNIVALGDTVLSPHALLEGTAAVEQEFGRVRGQRWGPRTLDVDVIAVGTLTSVDERITLPHPRAHQRAFVLRPWLDVDPEATVPGQGRVADLLERLGSDGLNRRDDLRLTLRTGPRSQA